jgi:RimJ/RimL family protein N-acetyltransferase
VVDIGFSLLDEFEGKGYAYEAASKVKSIGMDNFDQKSSLQLLQKTIFLPRN